MKINWNVRFKNPVFYMQVILAVLTPILAYMGLTMQDLTSWGRLIEVICNAISNPYILGLAAVSVWNALNDPTTKGLSDSSQALEYTEPKKS